MKAEIISIGNELLSGLTINTNASWIAQNFKSVGLEVHWITTIPDTANEIERALKTASSRADIIVCTGGLGPTPDDITKNTICKFFNTKMILHGETLEYVKKIFEGRHLKMPDINIDQAMIPEKATPLQNTLGTAPGLQFEIKNKLYFFLPGVPCEMKNLVDLYVLKKIKEKYNLSEIKSFLFRTTSIAESRLFEKLQPVLKKYSDIPIAFLPKFTGVDVRLIQKYQDDSISKFAAEIKNIISKYIYTENEEELAEVLGKILSKKNLNLSTAESFTGGLISDSITNISGSSDYFIAGITTYSNESKIKNLGVKESTIQKFGAVSEETAREMVIGVKKLFNTDCAISSTGIAGPTGATETKPVGLCYLAANYKDDIIVRKFNFGKNRRINKERGAVAGMELLRRLILGI
jgi:nicotinamide-nucleotide amidase